MNEALKTALHEARTTAEAALAAAQAGDHDEARRLLAALDELREDCAGGNAAANASRTKTLRIEADTLALLEAAQGADVTAEALEPAAAPAQAEQPAQEPHKAEQAPAPSKAPRTPAPAQHLPDADWGRVAAALTAQGASAEALAAEDARCTAQMEQARIDRQPTFRVRTLERQALQARVEAAALNGDYPAANKAWDRLFDVVTAIRTQEGNHRKKHGAADPEKAAAYDAAREASARIRRWARGVEASA